MQWEQGDLVGSLYNRASPGSWNRGIVSSWDRIIAAIPNTYDNAIGITTSYLVWKSKQKRYYEQKFSIHQQGYLGSARNNR